MSRKTPFPFAAAAVALLAAGSAFAQSGPKADEAVALVKSAIAHVKEAGEAKAYEDFTKDREHWVKGEYYVFCHSLDGVNLAHGGNAALVGKNVLAFKDPDGVEVNVKLIEKAKSEGAGWVKYRWPNPVTRKVEPKVIYLEKINNALCGSGYYE